MKKLLLFLLLFCAVATTAHADHITGGEMSYTYQGFSNGLHHYAVTYKLYMRCNSGRMFPAVNVVSLFDKVTGARINDISVPLANQTTISLPDGGPCIANAPVVCFEIAHYYFTVDVPPSANGYVLASEVNYRIRGINNVASNQVGAAYTCEFPGTLSRSDAQHNNSALFTGSDLVIVCAGQQFTYSFGATDSDGDELRYSFCDAYASTTSGNVAQPAGGPPFSALPYASGYDGTSPLGNAVTINPLTGLITGIAPDFGIYVVTVCVEEIRGGIVIARQRKDIQLNVADCTITDALLQDDYMLCRSSTTLQARNLNQSPLINTTKWTIRDASGTVIYSTNTTEITYTFATPGRYTLELIVNEGQECEDETAAPVFVFPGFQPAFTIDGICIAAPTSFTDRTTSATGIVNSWSWDFGEPSSMLDVSSQRNPLYQYPGTGSKRVVLTVTNDVGCRDTAIRFVTIIDRPPVGLAFNDTLICTGDRLLLRASGPTPTTTYAWSPPVNLINTSSATPTAFPVTTTKYYVDITTDGCFNRDSVLVRVVDHVSLSIQQDTIICSGDTIRLRVISDGLHFTWTPTAQVLDPTAKNPRVVTPATSTYTVRAVIGGCDATASTDVTAVPYPTAFAGKDTTICYNSTAFLHATTDGNSWQWTPVAAFSSNTTLNPVIHPLTTSSYIFTAFDNTRGCPKPGRDTIEVTVLPRITPFAGNDTAVVIGQPLQFQAYGGTRYLWSPATDLSAANIDNPVARYREVSNGIRYKVLVYNQAACVDSAFLTVKVFATLPSIFVPTAFSPNNDGRNDVLRAIAVGMQRFDYFSVYNRWGQLVFTTSNSSKGWDGRINGQLQSNGVFVWMVKAVDYTGLPYFRKGTVTLIQ